MTTAKKIYKQYFTPTEIAKLMINHIPRKNISKIVDLAVGDGELLKEAVKKFKGASLYGADIDSAITAGLKTNKDIKCLSLWTGDSLSSNIDSWSEYNHIVRNEKFCLCLGNPPFNFFNRENDKDSNDGKLAIEIRFLMKYFEITKESGYIAVILPNGILCNQKYSEIRKIMLQKSYIECIINLYDNSFKEVNADTSIIIMRKRSCTQMQKKVKIKSINTTFQENILLVSTDEAIERMDFGYHYEKQLILEKLEQLPYEMVPLAEVVGNCKRGISITKKQHCIANTGYRFIHTTNVDNIVVNNRDNTKISYKYENEFSRYRANVGDILIGRVGTKCINKVGIITKELENSIISDCLFVLSELKINPYYLALFIKSELGQKQLFYKKRGSCSKFITKDDLLGIYIPIVPKEIQRSFEIAVKKILSKYLPICDYDSINFALQEQLKKLELLMRWNNERVSINIRASTN